MLHEDNAHRTALAVAIFLIVLGVSETTCGSTHARGQESAYTLDDEALGRLFVSEVSGIRRPDWRPLGFIVRSRATARGVSVAGYIATHHHRHTRSHSRPYMAFLNRTMEYPAGWPESVEHWETVGRPSWQRVLDAAHAVNVGEVSHACSEPPADWGGREVDCEDLQDRLRGGWHEVDCGDTANMFIARGHVDPVPDLRCEEVHREAYLRRMARRAARAGVGPSTSDRSE